MWRVRLPPARWVGISGFLVWHTEDVWTTDRRSDAELVARAMVVLGHPEARAEYASPETLEAEARDLERAQAEVNAMLAGDQPPGCPLPGQEGT